MRIKNIISREILDSRGTPTVETDVILENGITGRTSVPSGASTGEREAVELRDNDPSRYFKKGVSKAVNNVNTTIKNALIGQDVENQKEIDEILIKLDGTKNKENLGANAILSVSLSCLKASANNKSIPLYKYVGSNYTIPYPMMNILNGGLHADNNLDFQEFMIMPRQSTFKERLRCGSEIFHCLKTILKENGKSTNVGDEGGFAPTLNTNEEAIEYIMKAIDKSGYKKGEDVYIALDIAASTFYNSKTKKYHCNNQDLTSSDMIKLYQNLINKYPIMSIEDPLDENDWEGYQEITKVLGKKIQIVGDDLFTTNKETLQKGLQLQSCNAILLKANQIGTVTELFDTIKLAKDNNYKTVISHRSGETEDTFIADLAVGLNLGQIKTGSVSRTDRICKYNQLLRIEEEL